MKVVGSVEGRTVAQRHLRPEAPIPKVRPVADLTVADPYDVHEPIAGHVRQLDRLFQIREDHERPLSLVEGHGHTLRLLEALLRPGPVPHERVVLRDQKVRATITVEVDVAEVRVIPVDVRQRLEGPKGLESPRFGPLEVPTEGTPER